MQSKHNWNRIVGIASGFTLVEVMVAVMIVIVLGSLIYFAVAGRAQRAAKREVLKSDLRQIIMAANIYRTDYDDKLPVNWKGMGYYGVNKKDKFGPGFPPHDVEFDKPPAYDVSYHTPECAAPPDASPAFLVFQPDVNRFLSQQRANELDIEGTHAVHFYPACDAGTFGTQEIKIMRNGLIQTIRTKSVKSLGANLAGTISYQWWPAWNHELAIGY